MLHNDVTICGAGISGLLMASELSKWFSVVVLEKTHRSQCSNKFWLTKKECLGENPELEGCVDSEWDELNFIANNRSKFTAKGQYILWDTKKLQSHLIESITANGSQIFYEHRFYGYRCTDNYICSYANNIALCSILLIDCMGYSSPIVSSANAVGILGYHHLYGRTMKLKIPITPVAIDNVILSGSPSFLEVFPKSDGTANVVLIAPAKSVQSMGKLASDFDFIVKGTHYADILSQLGESDALHGTVPIGKVKKRALNRVLFFGEAGQTHPAASCTCLNKLLLGYKAAASRVRQRISLNRLSARDLKEVMPQMGKFAQRFHQNLFRQLGSWTSDHGQSFVELLRCLDQRSLDDLIFGEIGPGHFAQIRNLKRVAEARNTIWVKPLVRTLLSL